MSRTVELNDCELKLVELLLSRRQRLIAEQMIREGSGWTAATMHVDELLPAAIDSMDLRQS